MGPWSVVASAVGILVLFFVIIAFIKRFMVICKPNEILILSGRKYLTETGKKGYKVIYGGRCYRMPVIERLNKMPMISIPIEINVVDAYSKGNIKLNVHAIGNCKISSDRDVTGNAIERFLQTDLDQVRDVARETLEGNLREVLATMTPEQVNEDRITFANKIKDTTEKDLKILGLHLDTLKIQHVADRSNYLNSIGRGRIASILRDAEISESDAKREAESSAAEANRRGEVAMKNAEAVIQSKENEYRKILADLEGEAKSAEETAIASAKAARAFAEQELQAIRGDLENIRLQSDVVLPAEADKKSKELKAIGEAAFIAEKGKAVAYVLSLMSDAWKIAGNDAKDIFLIQQLEKIVGLVVKSVQEVKVGEVSIIDSCESRGLANYITAYPEAVNRVLSELKNSIGLDIPAILKN